jgi:hypothetical protein
MREGISGSPGSRSRFVWTGVILVIIGVSVVVLIGEWFAMYDACVANPTRDAGAPVGTLETYLGFMVLGVVLAVLGVVLALTNARGEPHRALIVWL